MCQPEVEWREADESIPESTIWECNKTCPIEGELRWCQVCLEVEERLNTGRKRWLMYQTCYSLANGLERPEDLDALAIVEVEVLNVDPVSISRVGVLQWWHVRCLQVIPQASIPQRLPALPMTDRANIRPYGKLECASDTLYLSSWGTQAIETKIYTQDTAPYSPTYLVLYHLSIDRKYEIYNQLVK